MVNEPGSVSSLYVATPRDVVPFPTGAPSRNLAAVKNTQQASAGPDDRPGFSALVAQVRAAGEQRAEAASQLRAFQTNLQYADDLLAKIKEQLVHIVKQYPPFAQDDPQRLAYLNAVSGLRKQLDALTFPPERAQSDAEGGAGNDPVLFPSIPPNPLKGEAAVPELDPATAKDAEVQSALDAIRKMQQKVEEVQGAMWQDVVHYVGEPNLGAEAEVQARSQAGDVRGYVAVHSPNGIGLSLSSILSIGL